jgi:tRNA A-37 threonylcarbamoyl transferase component Bud32
MQGAEYDRAAPVRARLRSLGKYELCAQLDGGGQAQVFLALMRGQAGFHKLAVIKRLHSAALTDATQLNMFLSEARLAARLAHPNIVHTYEVGEQDGEFFIVMEYLQGQPMSRLAHNPAVRSRFGAVMWARVVSEALRGLGYAHNLADYDGTPLDIVHRDISPDNLFLTYDGEVKVVDFGVAKALLNSDKTETGTLKGKISYMAPEQVMGTVDRRADLFGMGAVLWEFLTGEKLFEGSRPAVLYRLMNDPIPSLASRLPQIDPALVAIVDRALAKDPADRFCSAEDMRKALEEFIRASGDVVPEVQLGEVIRDVFADTRLRVQQQVQAALERAPRGVGDEPQLAPFSALAPLPEIAAFTPSRPLASPWPLHATAPGALGEMPAPLAASPPRLSKTARRSAVAALLAVAVAVALLVALLRRDEGTPAAVAPPPEVIEPVVVAPPPVAPTSAMSHQAPAEPSVPAKLATSAAPSEDVAPAAQRVVSAPPTTRRGGRRREATQTTNPRAKEVQEQGARGPKVQVIDDEPKPKIDVINE